MRLLALYLCNYQPFIFVSIHLQTNTHMIINLLCMVSSAFQSLQYKKDATHSTSLSLPCQSWLIGGQWFSPNNLCPLGVLDHLFAPHAKKTLKNDTPSTEIPLPVVVPIRSNPDTRNLVIRNFVIRNLGIRNSLLQETISASLFSRISTQNVIHIRNIR